MAQAKPSGIVLQRLWNLGKEWNYDSKHLELIKPGIYTLKSLSLASWCRNSLIAWTLASSWGLGATLCSDNESLVSFPKATGLFCLATSCLPCTDEEMSVQVGDVMGKPWLSP